jgi:hypothetical protein
MSNKDLHVSFRINKEMLQYHEKWMAKICELAGRKVPQSHIMRATMAIMRDDDVLRKRMTKKIVAYLKSNFSAW